MTTNNFGMYNVCDVTSNIEIYHPILNSIIESIRKSCCNSESLSYEDLHNKSVLTLIENEVMICGTSIICHKVC